MTGPRSFGSSLLLGIPPLLSLLLLAAHFLRSGQLFIVLFLLAAATLLAVPGRWAVRSLQAILLLGTLEWLRTLLVLAQLRHELQQPYLRMGLILAAVALFTLLSAWLTGHRRRPAHQSGATPDPEG